MKEVTASTTMNEPKESLAIVNEVRESIPIIDEVWE